VERIQILAGISRRLQTPITRMRLRADFLGDSDAKEKLQGDLQEMQMLVKQGLALARESDDIGPGLTAHVAVEALREPS
jgi:signal transduction histidine kinase